MGKISYKYDDKHGDMVLIKTYNGDIFLQDIIESWDQAIDGGIVKPKTKGVLNDYRNAVIKFPSNDIEALMEYFSNTGVFNEFRFALLMNEPNQVVYPVLAKTICSDFFTEPFSTQKAALRWILEGKRQ